MKQTILRMAKLMAWGFIEAISFIARHPEVLVAIIITILMLKLSHAICMSIIYQ